MHRQHRAAFGKRREGYFADEKHFVIIIYCQHYLILIIRARYMAGRGKPSII